MYRCIVVVKAFPNSGPPPVSLTMVLDVTAAPLQDTGHLSVDGVQAELCLSPSLRRAAAWRLHHLQLGRMGELQRLQQSRLTLHEVGDGVD